MVEGFEYAVDGDVARLTFARPGKHNAISFQISVACDFRFAAAGSRFGITPSKLGIVYDYLSTRQLVALVGPAHARYFLLSGELVDAHRAREIGLVNDTFDAGELEPSMLALSVSSS